jgi:hypothetical protein
MLFVCLYPPPAGGLEATPASCIYSEASVACHTSILQYATPLIAWNKKAPYRTREQRVTKNKKLCETNVRALIRKRLCLA